MTQGARRAAALWGLAVLTLPTPSFAEQVSDTNSPYTVSARLDFRINIGKYMYLRVGPPGAGLATVGFNVGAVLPGAPTVATNGNSQAVPWTAAAPTFTVSPSNNVLAVEVGSNAGTVSLQATVLSPLAAGSAVIPMGSVTVSSDNGGLPAPAIPAAGTGAAVTVSGTAFGNLVTQRSANWTFGLNAGPSIRAGSYSGQVGFTAVAP
ncbi:hypothetical protein [Pseudacidovorax intermedius]|uniref:Uncharacterized protein n=1 Tax=Pseudacidovorax intermedius TaxID=433924 RepID=A0A370F8Y5_9BURK|nr:hypothetical protein [Pseudacidovorax intermedius]RDI21263.1 hypothetical protein DFR41_10959 [Pseudacidovorax intermedius]